MSELVINRASVASSRSAGRVIQRTGSLKGTLTAGCGVVAVVAGVAGMVAPGRSEAQPKPQPAGSICGELLAFEEDTNRTLPRPVDEATELIQVRVNCDNQTVAYTKRLLLDPATLAEGWQERKQRQYVQLHCNAQGLASVAGWNAMDVLLDPAYNYLLTLKATPADCNQ